MKNSNTKIHLAILGIAAAILFLQNNFLFAQGIGHWRIGATGNPSSNGVDAVNATNNLFGTPTGVDLRFGTNGGTERMRIMGTTTGNIGIIGDNDVAGAGIGASTNNKVETTQYFSVAPPDFNLEIRGKTGLRIFNGIYNDDGSSLGGKLDLWSDGAGKLILSGVVAAI